MTKNLARVLYVELSKSWFRMNWQSFCCLPALADAIPLSLKLAQVCEYKKQLRCKYVRPRNFWCRVSQSVAYSGSTTARSMLANIRLSHPAAENPLAARAVAGRLGNFFFRQPLEHRANFFWEAFRWTHSTRLYTGDSIGGGGHDV